MRAIDLFAGAGGLSLGLQMAGINVVAAIDHDHDACETYRANIADHIIEADIHDIDPANLPDCELIAGGPPCQGFSFAGKRDKDDPRNQLWKQYFRIVEAKQPAFILIENVRGMLAMGEDKALIWAFQKIGYRVTPYLCNAADYGVPQNRYRVFFVGNRLGLDNPAPTQTHTEPNGTRMMFGLQSHVTVRQALGIGTSYDLAPNIPLDDPSPTILGMSENGGPKPIRHGLPIFTERTDHGVLDLDQPSCVIKAGGGIDASGHEGGVAPPSIPNIPLDAPSPTIQGGGSDTGGAEPVRHRLRNRYAEHGEGSTYDEPAPTVSADRGLEAHWLADSFEVAPTIQADSRVSKPGHHGPGEPRMMLRRLTPRECATLQDFPAWFTFTGTKTSQHRQIGNAVPPGMARAVGTAILAAFTASLEAAA